MDRSRKSGRRAAGRVDPAERSPNFPPRDLALKTGRFCRHPKTDTFTHVDRAPFFLILFTCRRASSIDPTTTVRSPVRISISQLGSTHAYRQGVPVNAYNRDQQSGSDWRQPREREEGREKNRSTVFFSFPQGSVYARSAEEERRGEKFPLRGPAVN